MAVCGAQATGRLIGGLVALVVSVPASQLATLSVSLFLCLSLSFSFSYSFSLFLFSFLASERSSFFLVLFPAEAETGELIR